MAERSQSTVYPRIEHHLHCLVTQKPLHKGTLRGGCEHPLQRDERALGKQNAGAALLRVVCPWPHALSSREGAPLRTRVSGGGTCSNCKRCAGLWREPKTVAAEKEAHRPQSVDAQQALGVPQKCVRVTGVRTRGHSKALRGTECVTSQAVGAACQACAIRLDRPLPHAVDAFTCCATRVSASGSLQQHPVREGGGCGVHFSREGDPLEVMERGSAFPDARQGGLA